MEATWTVVYINRGSTTTRNAIVKISMYDAKFTATNLELWGCGKESFSPAGAIRNLVQDMATICEMYPNV